MFTGLVEEIGTMKNISRHGESLVLTVAASVVTEGVKLGDSISVNGVCLTVVAFDRTSFKADVVPETYRRSNLHRLKAGDLVNLERAMQAGGRFGGHIVQGHVDGTGVIVSREREANAVVFGIVPDDPANLKYMLPKGSVAIDGISLTIADASPEGLFVSIIPHTLAETALQHKRTGEQVNIECDIIGKYVEHLLRFERPNAQGSRGKSGMSVEYLAEHGFM